MDAKHVHSALALRFFSCGERTAPFLLEFQVQHAAQLESTVLLELLSRNTHDSLNHTLDLLWLQASALSNSTRVCALMDAPMVTVMSSSASTSYVIAKINFWRNSFAQTGGSSAGVLLLSN